MNIIATSPPMLPQHLPRARMRGGLSTMATTQQLVCPIHHMSIKDPDRRHMIRSGHLSPLSTTSPRSHHNGTLNSHERPKMRVGGPSPHTRLAKPCHPNNANKGVQHPPNPTPNGGRHPSRKGTRGLADNTAMYPRRDDTSQRITTSLRHKTDPATKRGPRPTLTAGTTL